jgi:sugar/nucleoside kinase (ribokinase family)
LFQPSVCVPQSSIKGTVGAGDAFAAGVLAGFHEEWAMEECLRIGVCAAATSLLDNTASGSIRPWRQCLTYGETLGFNMDMTLNQRQI